MTRRLRSRSVGIVEAEQFESEHGHAHAEDLSGTQVSVGYFSIAQKFVEGLQGLLNLVEGCEQFTSFLARPIGRQVGKAARDLNGLLLAAVGLEGDARRLTLPRRRLADRVREFASQFFELLL